MGVIYQMVIEGGSRTYIGSAFDLAGRKRAHLHLLRNGRHHCRALQNAVTKYGVDAIQWVILETVDDRSKLVEREQVWLDLYAGRLYNKSPTAASRLGATMSDEARAKISASLMGNQYRKGIPFTPEDKAKVSAGLRAAYADGRWSPTPMPENLRAYNDAYRRGERKHPKVNAERDARIVADFAITNCRTKTGRNFNLTGSAIGYAIKRHQERTATCATKQGI